MAASRATSRSARRRLRAPDVVWAWVLAGLLAAPVPAQAWELGGDVRYYQFVRLDDPAGARRDAELAALRLKLSGRFSDELTAEAHGLVSATSPASPATASIATGTTRRFFRLEHTEASDDDFEAVLALDRLNVGWDRRDLRVVAGRQAITWGVNFFWPALDLFAPFPPERIDREYKPGVDAVRLIVPVGRLSQVEVVAAAQGRDLQDDGSVAALGRVHLGPADVGVMAGRFHRDTVAGGFFTANVAGTGLRGEVAYTDSASADDARIDRKRFWRASVGVDRQLTPTIAVMAEIAWNGFGADDPDDYPTVAAADRVRRGEVNSLGRTYVGASLTWQAHPLVAVTGAALVNAGDGSALLLPHADWSLSDSVTLVFGGLVGLGPGEPADQRPRSEYGGAPAAVYGAVKLYF